MVHRNRQGKLHDMAGSLLPSSPQTSLKIACNDKRPHAPNPEEYPFHKNKRTYAYTYTMCNDDELPSGRRPTKHGDSTLHTNRRQTIHRSNRPISNQVQPRQPIRHGSIRPRQQCHYWRTSQNKGSARITPRDDVHTHISKKQRT